MEKIVIKGTDEEEDAGRKTATKAAWIVASVIFLVSLFVIVASFWKNCKSEEKKFPLLILTPNCCKVKNMRWNM